MAPIRLNNIRYHFEGIRGKVMQMRELVEVIDQMFDSFHKVNELSKTILPSPKSGGNNDFEER